jgi:hypothetical protein
MRAGNTYVNVHTEEHPNGEIRGQIEIDEKFNEDANRDGVVGMPDLLDVVKHVRDRTPHGMSSRFLDTDLDGDVTIHDVLSVVQRLRTDRAESDKKAEAAPALAANATFFDLLAEEEDEDELLSDTAFLADVAQARR